MQVGKTSSMGRQQNTEMQFFNFVTCIMFRLLIVELRNQIW